jgi:hypothetical protein
LSGDNSSLLLNTLPKTQTIAESPRVVPYIDLKRKGGNRTYILFSMGDPDPKAAVAAIEQTGVFTRLISYIDFAPDLQKIVSIECM